MNLHTNNHTSSSNLCSNNKKPLTLLETKISHHKISPIESSINNTMYSRISFGSDQNSTVNHHKESNKYRMRIVYAASRVRMNNTRRRQLVKGIFHGNLVTVDIRYVTFIFFEFGTRIPFLL